VLLTDGILRTRYRRSRSDPQPLVPGDVYRLTINLSATANRFAAGHRIRLEIAGSNFPRFDVNTNTGLDIAQSGPDALVRALNTVYHDEQRPSYLLLAIVAAA